MSTRTLDRADMSRRGRIGGYVTASLYDGRVQTERARQVYRESFADHSACGLCRNPAPLPDGLSDAERARRASATRMAHYARLARLSARARAR